MYLAQVLSYCSSSGSISGGAQGKLVIFSGSQRVGVLKWELWGMVPPSWLSGVGQDSIHCLLLSQVFLCAHLAREGLSWEVALREHKIPGLTASH